MADAILPPVVFSMFVMPPVIAPKPVFFSAVSAAGLDDAASAVFDADTSLVSDCVAGVPELTSQVLLFVGVFDSSGHWAS